MDILQLIHLQFDEHLGCFQVTPMNSTAVNICVQSLYGHLFLFLLDKCLVAKCLDHNVCMFNILKNFQFYQVVAQCLHYYLQCMRILIILPHQYLLLSE